jgi:3-hydroxybutyryl-CoA dehydrogenase
MSRADSRSAFDPTLRPTAVIGAGTLGMRIALMFASSGGEVRLYDPKADQLEVAKRFLDEELPKLVKERSGAKEGPIVYEYAVEAAVADAWLIAEAVPERLDLKKAIFGDLDRLAPKDAILASNSSSYPSSQMIDRVTDPSRVVSMHFYMPPTQNAVEVMSCGKTSDAVIEVLMERLPLYGLVPFHVMKESVGFIFNRIWAAIKRESLLVVEEGVSTPSEVDRMFQLSFGTPAGPFRLMDKVGLDVVLAIEEHYATLRPGLPEGPRKLLKKYIGEGRLGEKSGKGFYDYQTKVEPPKPTAEAVPDVSVPAG